MPKFETLDSTALNEAIRSSFTEKEFRNHSFDRDCSDMILSLNWDIGIRSHPENFLRCLLQEGIFF